MVNINELEWATVEGSEYPVAKVNVGIEEVTITKYDEDSFLLTSGGNYDEVNLSQLETMILKDQTPWKDKVGSMSNVVVIPDVLEKWYSSAIWTNVPGVGSAVLEIPHAKEDGGTLRIIKMDEDSYKIAVIGIPPNDGEIISYFELDLLAALMNYSYALGLGIDIGKEYYNKLKAEKAASEQTDYETID